MLNKLTVATLLACASILASTAPVLAEAAVATGGVNVRSTPQVLPNNKVGTLTAGELVNVTQCTAPSGGWCYIDMSESGVVGWVSAAYLAEAPQGGGGGGGGGGGSNIPFNFGVNITPGQPPSFSFGLGNGPLPPPPAPPPPATAQVCVYKGSNMSGSELCLPSGTNLGNLNFNSWNNNIQSLDVSGGASILVCVNNNYAAPCTLYNSDRNTLPAAYNNTISSLRVF